MLRGSSAPAMESVEVSNEKKVALWIKECGVKKCRWDNSGWHYHSPNPKGQAMKGVEMTVRRALAIIEIFDNLPPEAKDWTDAEPKDLRKVMGDDSFNPSLSIWPELWARYKDGRLQQATLELADNVNLEDLSKKARKEIEDGIARISEG